MRWSALLTWVGWGVVALAVSAAVNSVLAFLSWCSLIKIIRINQAINLLRQAPNGSWVTSESKSVFVRGSSQVALLKRVVAHGVLGWRGGPRAVETTLRRARHQRTLRLFFWAPIAVTVTGVGAYAAWQIAKIPGSLHALLYEGRVPHPPRLDLMVGLEVLVIAWWVHTIWPFYVAFWPSTEVPAVDDIIESVADAVLDGAEVPSATTDEADASERAQKFRLVADVFDAIDPKYRAAIDSEDAPLVAQLATERVRLGRLLSSIDRAGSARLGVALFGRALAVLQLDRTAAMLDLAEAEQEMRDFLFFLPGELTLPYAMTTALLSASDPAA